MYVAWPRRRAALAAGIGDAAYSGLNVIRRVRADVCTVATTHSWHIHETAYHHAVWQLLSQSLLSGDYLRCTDKIRMLILAGEVLANPSAILPSWHRAVATAVRTPENRTRL